MSPQGERSIGYQPALDGLRALSLIMVLIFHLGFTWMTGGYLGVSIFFTLSGFLITTLLVTELNRTGDVCLRRFYGRRARRLLPASLVALAGACVLIAADLVPDRSGLRWYIFGGLFQFANWVPLGLRDSYGELFNTLSPTDHFWSLAIEEQFYWVWPLTLLGLFRLIRRRSKDAGDKEFQPADWTRSLLWILVSMFLVFGISAPVTAHFWNGDAAYFATWARVPEIIAGAVLAVFVLRNRLPVWVSWLGPAALTVIVVLLIVTPASGGFAYSGALPLFAILSAAVIAGLQHDSLLTRLLSIPPMVFLGRISYGMYLYHWPVFVVLTQARTGLDQLPLSVLRLAVTLAISLVSFFLIEQPIRERRVLARPRLALLSTGLMIPLVALLGVTQVSNTSSFEETGDTIAPVAGTLAPLVTTEPESTSTVASPTPTVTSPTTTSATATTSPTTTNAPATTSLMTSIDEGPVPTTSAPQLVPPRPVRILVIGDSTALATGVGLSSWAEQQPDLAVVEVQGFGGCGLMSRSEKRFQNDWLSVSQGCIDLFETKVPDRIREAQPDIVVIISSFWDVTDHRSDLDPIPHSVIDPEYRDEMLSVYTQYTQLLLDTGAPRVALVLYPATDYEWEAEDEPADDPERFVALHAIERSAAAQQPGRASVIDLAAWSDDQGLTEDRDARPDGVHWTPEQSTAIATEWLGNEIVQAALR